MSVDQRPAIENLMVERRTFPPDPGDIAQGRALGDTTTLADATVVETIRANSGKGEE